MTDEERLELEQIKQSVEEDNDSYFEFNGRDDAKFMTGLIDRLSARCEELEKVLEFNTSGMAKKIFANMKQEKDHHPSSIINFIDNDHWIYQICCAVRLDLDKVARAALDGEEKATVEVSREELFKLYRENVYLYILDDEVLEAMITDLLTKFRVERR